MTNSPHILVVDDARDIRDPLARYLENNGFRTSKAEDADAARKHLESAAIDLVVLDIMMPGEDGLSLCRDLRAKSSIPVILLTALSEETDRIVGLEIGADDYVTKPFSPRELMARIKVVLRRADSGSHGNQQDLGNGSLRFDGWELKLGERELVNPNHVTVPISTAEFHLLTAFLTHPKQVLTRDQLLDLAHGRQAQIFDRSIDNQVSRLRRKIEPDAKNPKYIKTVWGGGYSWTADVEKA